MALVFVSKDMDVSTPVGHVNLHPLPDLPSGLTRFHLMRQSLSMVKRNLVDFSVTNLQEYRYGTPQEGETREYNDTNVYTDTRGLGWLDSTWTFPYEGGCTWMSVFDYDTVTENIAQISAGDWRDSGGGTAVLTVRDGNVRSGGAADSPGALADAGVGSPPPTDSIMGFASFRGGASPLRRAYVPHNGNLDEKEPDLSGFTPDNEAVMIGISSTSTNDPHYNRQYAIAEWGRVLSQSEMDSAYDALKPWLLARGVRIV